MGLRTADLAWGGVRGVCLGRQSGLAVAWSLTVGAGLTATQRISSELCTVSGGPSRWHTPYRCL